jgi:hypothetical protein
MSCLFLHASLINSFLHIKDSKISLTLCGSMEQFTLQYCAKWTAKYHIYSQV